MPTVLAFLQDGTLVSSAGVAGVLQEARGGGPPAPWLSWGSQHVGRRVTLRGLTAAASLNGSAALVVGANAAAQRLNVKLVGSGEMRAVREEHLGEAWGAELLGARVRLQGLAKAAHLNGSVGVVVSAAPETQRWSVQLEGGEVVAVRRESMVTIAA